MNEESILFHTFHGHAYNQSKNPCDTITDYDGNMGLRISSIFVIMIFSCIGVFSPLIVYKIKWIRISQILHFFARFYGTGIIIGMVFIHLLQQSIEELGSPCLVGLWRSYNFSPILIIIGMISIFLLELFSLRYINLKYNKNSIHSGSTSLTHISSSDEDSPELRKDLPDNMKNDFEKHDLNKYLMKKNILTFIILELGIIFHSIIIGFTLAVTSDDEFVTLYIVLSFHQMFEGLGFGVRLFDTVQDNNSVCNWFFAFIYSIIMPISIAVGLIAKATNNLQPSTTIVVSGIFNSLSSGILIYAGLVDFLAQDFIINSDVRNGSFSKLLYAILCILLGLISMSIIEIWT